MDGTEVRRELIGCMTPKCKDPDLRCTPAFLAVDNLVRHVEAGGELDLDKIKKTLGNCALGPTLVGVCGTAEVICQHDLVAETLEQERPDPNEQIEIVTQRLM